MNEEEPGVARFFKQFGVVGAVWLVSLPVYSISPPPSRRGIGSRSPPSCPPPTSPLWPPSASSRCRAARRRRRRRRDRRRRPMRAGPRPVPIARRRRSTRPLGGAARSCGRADEPAGPTTAAVVGVSASSPANVRRPPARPRPSAHRVTVATHSLFTTVGRAPTPARAHRARAATHHTRAPPLAQATPREMCGCGRRRCSTTAHRRAVGRRTRCRRYNRGRPAPSIPTRVRQRPRRRSVSTLQRAPPPTYRRRRWYCRRRRRPCGRLRRAAQQPHARREDPRRRARAWRGLDARRKLADVRVSCVAQSRGPVP